MLDEICGSIHNYFEDADNVRGGLFIIEDGALELPFLADGQYFRIVGSLFNDGVFQYPAEGLQDEEFYGEIWPMRPPRAFLQLCEQIADWQDKFGDAVAGPFASESVNGYYNYTKAANVAEASGAGWEKVFGKQLNRWRKLA